MLKELKGKPYWLCYSMQPKGGGKFTKEPRGRENRKISIYDKSKLMTYAEATATQIKYKLSGLGYSVACDADMVFIDIDHCIDESGALSETATDIIQTVDSYTEISPSGTGIHIYAYGADLPPEVGRRKGGIEIYKGKQYTTITDRPYGTPKPIQERSEAIFSVIEKYIWDFDKSGGDPGTGSGADQHGSGSGAGLSDEQIIERITSTEDGRKLWGGDYSAYPGEDGEPDHSRADQALCNMLAYWSQNNAEQIERLFNQSGLIRDKWNRRKDYRERTIHNAINKTVNPYKPPLSEFSEGSEDPREDTQKAKPEAPTISPVGCYLDKFTAYINEHRERISTGYKQLDIVLNGGFTNELYILGAETGQGKSALAMCIAQNVARAGQDVLFFALEMSRRELIARGISCYSDRIGDHRVTTGDVLYFHYDELLDQFVKVSPERYRDAQQAYFKECGGHLYFIENKEGGLTAADIGNITRAFTREHGTTPLVIVDYLQMLRGSEADRKTKVDYAVNELKVLSYNMPVLVLSSVNRQSYKERVKLDSFKESGDIEYTGGVLIGLTCEPTPAELRRIIEDCTMYGKGGKEIVDDEAKEKAILNYKAQPERSVTLELLKYRNGAKRAQVRFDYHACFNNFVES